MLILFPMEEIKVSLIKDKYWLVLEDEIKQTKQIVGMSIPKRQRGTFLKKLPTEGFLSYLLLLVLSKKQVEAQKEKDVGYPYYMMKANLEPKGEEARLISEAGAYAQPHFEPKETLRGLGIFDFNNGSIKDAFIQKLISELTWEDKEILLEQIIKDHSSFFSKRDVFYPPPSKMIQQKVLPSQYPTINLVDIWTGKLRDLSKKIDPSSELLKDGLDFLAKTVEAENIIPDYKIEVILGDLINTYLEQVTEIWCSWVQKGDNIKALKSFLESLIEMSLRYEGTPKKALERIGRSILNSLAVKEKLENEEKELRKLAQGFMFKPLLLEGALPLLNVFTNKIKNECDSSGRDYPFRNYILVIIQHFLRDLDPFVEAFQKLGAVPKDIILFCKPYPYPHEEALMTHFEKREKVNVIKCEGLDVASSDIKKVFQKVLKRHKSTGKKLLIIEDGGYFGPYIHKRNKVDVYTLCQGAVEQTTKGSREYQKVEKKYGIKIPLMNVAKSDFKKNYEAPLIGRTVVRNIRSMLPEKHLDRQKALVIGFGSIGREIAKCLYNCEGMKVIVAELRDTAKLQEARDAKDFVEKAVSKITRRTVQDCILIIGTTGTRTINKNIIGYALHGTILASASSDRKEIEVNALEDWRKKEMPIEVEGAIVGTKYKLTIQNDKEILLLANGYPINFFASESVPNESIDPILTTLFLSAVEIATKRIQPGIYTDLVDKLIKKYKLQKEFEHIHRAYP